MQDQLREKVNNDKLQLQTEASDYYGNGHFRNNTVSTNQITPQRRREQSAHTMNGGGSHAAYKMIFEDDHEECMSDRFEFSEPKVVIFGDDDDSMDSLINFR